MDPSEYMIDFTKIRSPQSRLFALAFRVLTRNCRLTSMIFMFIEKNNVCKSKKRELKGFKKIKSLPPAIRLSLLSLGQKN